MSTTCSPYNKVIHCSNCSVHYTSLISTGREFQCVFLSTAEPTTPEGGSKNPTKTSCSQYVFNTALTRAKSLVVCAGNPFLLMKIEEKMGQANERSCWKEYIRRCMECNTLHVPSLLGLGVEERQKKLETLQQKVFTTKTDSRLTDPSSEKKLDSITLAYKKAFEKLSSCQRCRIQLKTAQGGLQWQIKEKGDPQEMMREQQPSAPADLPQVALPKETVLCNLEFVSPRKALAHPLDTSKPVVNITGLGNRRGAFDGDVVAVELYPSEADAQQQFGKVVQVVQKCHQERYVCTVDRHSTLHFIPIDKKTPHFVNLPRISRDLLGYTRKDIEAGLEAQKDWVVVFDENSLPLSGEDELPKIKEIISAETSRRMLFVVQELGWDPKYRLPLGAVVESLPLGTNFFHAERLLKAAYSIDVDDTEPNAEEEEGEDEVEPPANLVRQAFTIDPTGAHNLDDALSLVQVEEGRYRMSVLIANVARQIKCGDKVDKLAEARGTSVYGSRENRFLRNMLPSSLCQKLSLLPKKIRDVLIVSTMVTVSQDGSIDSIDSACTISEGKLQSQVQLDYDEAQCLLDEQALSATLQQKLQCYPQSQGQPNPSLTLQILYKIAMHLRVQRLGRAAHAYEISEEDVKQSWQAHLLVGELMVWANEAVARFVHHKLPELALLRRQPAPSEQELKEFVEDFAGVLGHSIGMSTLEAGCPTDPLLIPRCTLQQLQVALRKALQSQDTSQLKLLLTSDHLYPQLSAAKACLRRISQRAEYVCSSSFLKLQPRDTSQSSISPFRHYSLCQDYYTHFTSPIRRCCDLVVQRLLLSILNELERPYKANALEKLCRHINIRNREAKLFQREMNRLEVAQRLGVSCEETQAFIVRNKSKFQVCFPELGYQQCLKRENTEFHISDLVCQEKGGTLQWRASLTSFKGQNFALGNPQLCTCVEDRSSDGSSQSFEDPVIKMTVFFKDHKAKAALDDQDTLQKAQHSYTLLREVVSLDPEKWQRALSIVDDHHPTNEKLRQLSSLLPHPQEEVDHTPPDPATVEKFKQSPILKYEVKHKIGSNSVVSLWLGRTLLRQPILAPCLQLLQVAPELRICLQHNSHPAECFSDPDLCLASKKGYTSIQEYISLWEKVFLAEVACDSVQSSPLIILKDVPLEWPTLKIPENCATDLYYLPNGPIKLAIPPECQDFLQYDIRISVGDLVCVRYNVVNKRTKETLRAVYHLVVSLKYTSPLPGSTGHSDSETEEDKVLHLEMKAMCKSSCQVSLKMADVLRESEDTPTCELQLIHLQESYK